MPWEAIKSRSSPKPRTSRFMPSPKGQSIRYDEKTTRIHAGTSYKFHRLFPLSEYDLPTHNSNILSFPRSVNPVPPNSAGDTFPIVNDPPSSKVNSLLAMTPDQISRNPSVDYTRYATHTSYFKFFKFEQTRFDHSRFLGCGKPYPRGCQSVSRRNVCGMTFPI
jgi:hypothetical protein